MRSRLPLAAGLLLALLMLAGAGCAPTLSQYERRHTAPSELVWRYDGELTLYKDGRLVAEEDWAGLTGAVTGVPRAEVLAQAARGHRVSGNWLRWLGVTVIVSSAVVSLTSLPSDDEYTGSPLDHRSFWIGVGGLTAGSAMGFTGLHQMYKLAPAEAVDAVNVYNSELLKPGD